MHAYRVLGEENIHLMFYFNSFKSHKWYMMALCGPLAGYLKLWVAHVLGMPGTFSPPPTSKETSS